MDQTLTATQAPGTSDGGRGATILIVEDSPVQTELLRRALEGAGYKVIAASDGAEGLALAKANRPAALVSDINMPVMDGYALCQAIRHEESLKSTPVILLTMLSDPQDVIRGLNAGADAYLTKPYNIPALTARVESLLAYPPIPPPPVERRKVAVRLAGETHLVDAHGPRMLNLLISTYENAVLQNRELTATQQALDDLNQHLEQKVLQKTAELRQSEQRFRALIENTSDLVLVIDAHGMITYVSPSVRRVGGDEPGELLGKSITAFLHPDDIPLALANLSALVHSPGTLQTTELRYRGKNGDSIILETVAKSAIDDPAIAGVVVNARDITERKRSEQALRLFRELIDQSTDTIEVIDPETARFLDFNEKACEDLGYSRGELLTMTVFDIDADLKPTAMQGIDTQLRSTGTVTIESRHRRKDGSTFPVEINLKRIELERLYYLAVVRDITERKWAEDALKKSEARYRSYIEVTGQLAWATAADGRVVEDIPTWRAFTGLGEEQVKGWGWTEALHPDDRERAAQIWREAVARKGVYEVEYRVLRHDGIYRDFFTRGVPVLNESGGVREWVGTSIDITERRLAEAARAELATLVASSHDAIYGSDVNGIVTVWNPGAEQMFGYGASEVVGRPVTMLAPADLADEPLQLRQRALRGERVSDFETVRLHKDGRLIDVAVTVSPIWDASGNAVGMSIVARDISERKRAEGATAASAIMYRRLFEAARDGILILDVQSGQIVDVNLFMIELLGYTREQYLGKKLWEIGPFKDTAAAKATFEELQKKKYVRYEGLPLHTADGRDIDVEFVSHVYRVNGGEVIQCNIRDITERKRAEEEFRRLNWALRALGQSNSALVHAGTEKELFQACCDAIAGSEGYPLAWIGLTIDDPAYSVAIAAAAGDAVTYLQDLKVSSGEAAHGKGPAGTAIRTGATQVANHLAECEAYLPWVERARARGLASAIALPIRADGGVMGALMIYGREVDAFARAEVELFEELAADIGYGIASRRTVTQRDHLQQEQLLGVERLKSALIGTIGAVALTVEKRDPYTAGHQLRVAELCVAIGRKLDFAEDRLEGLRLGATIHDIGKIYVPAEILNRPGKLSKPEFEIITSHPQVGYDIIKDVKFPWPVREMILQHHERLDGSGYPQGLKGDEIILEARILAVADVIEAMSSHRPYRPGLGLDSALAQVRQEAGTKLDAQVVDACERVFHEQGFSFSKA